MRRHERHGPIVMSVLEQPVKVWTLIDESEPKRLALVVIGTHLDKAWTITPAQAHKLAGLLIDAATYAEAARHSRQMSSDG
jgi:hypothetical protein